jgi:hypothetical protein
MVSHKPQSGDSSLIFSSFVNKRYTETGFLYPPSSELHLFGGFAVQATIADKACICKVQSANFMAASKSSQTRIFSDQKRSPKTPSDHSLGRGYVDFLWLDCFPFRDDDFQHSMI